MRDTKMEQLGHDSLFDIVVDIDGKVLEMTVIYGNEKKLITYLNKAKIKVLQVKQL
jgi:hypothetical protein